MRRSNSASAPNYWIFPRQFSNKICQIDRDTFHFHQRCESRVTSIGGKMKVGIARLGAFLACIIFSLSAASADETVTYSYDELGRLVAVSATGTVNNGQSASTIHDPVGNRTNHMLAGASLLTEGGQ